MELETTKQKNKENLQQAILIERERLTRMQWDMEELRQKSLEMELKLESNEVSIFNIILALNFVLVIAYRSFLLNILHATCQFVEGKIMLSTTMIQKLFM